jgi:hypothetical protein
MQPSQIAISSGSLIGMVLGRAAIAFEREAYDRSDNSGKHLVNDPTAERSAEGKTIIWKIDAPQPNWVYKISWEW